MKSSALMFQTRTHQNTLRDMLMAPDAKTQVQFIIELLPGMPPISKGPYRMPVNELVELKKEIAELQSKDSFILVHPLGEHPCCSWKRKTEHNGCAWITSH
jgi:hypothetical protein